MVDSADPDRIGDSKEELRLMLEAGESGGCRHRWLTSLKIKPHEKKMDPTPAPKKKTRLRL